jgi:hypothetical protein
VSSQKLVVAAAVIGAIVFLNTQRVGRNDLFAFFSQTELRTYFSKWALTIKSKQCKGSHTLGIVMGWEYSFELLPKLLLTP